MKMVIPRWLQGFIRERGITELHTLRLKSNKPSIGFSESMQTWYGWTHREARGFRIGYVVKGGPLDRSMPVGFEVKTLEDAKRCAIAFADSVS